MQHIYTVVDFVRDRLRDYGVFRFVVAQGPVAYPSGAMRQMGGPVFRDASQALDNLKTSGRFALWLASSEHALSNDILDTLTNLSNVLIETMTDNQYEIYRALRDGHSQTQIADALGKYPQAISKTVKRSQAALVIDTESVLLRTLKELDVQAGREAET